MLAAYAVGNLELRIGSAVQTSGETVPVRVGSDVVVEAL